MKVVTLLYHDVTEPGRSGESGFSGADAEIYKLATADFEKHLDAIAATRHLPRAKITDVLKHPHHDIPVLLSFDDGGASVSSIADMLDLRHWKGHFFITTNFIGSSGFVDKATIRDLHARGHVIGSHSASHPRRISHLGDAELQAEWERSVQTLQDLLGQSVRTASVPGGFYSRRVAEFAARAGIRALFNSEPVVRAVHVDKCVVLGRFGLQRHSPPELAAKFAKRHAATMLREAAFWKTKKLIKAAGGERWLAFRKWWLAR
jgi:peptidoglycan/xylan/chitin deacetylase (PgdA/CDA1 family)